MMLKSLLFIMLTCSHPALAQQQWFRSISIGSNSLDISSILDVNSTTKGSRPCPVMTEVQRDAISSPAAGLCIYNSDDDLLNFYNGTIWGDIGSGGGGGSSAGGLQLIGKGTANWTYAAAIPGNVLIQQDTNTGAVRTLSANENWGFVFTPTVTGDIKFIVATWKNVNATAGNIKVSVRATTAGVPTGAELTSKSSALTLGNQGILNSNVNFVFTPSGVQLIKDTPYYIGFENNGGNGTIEITTSTTNDSADINYEDLTPPFTNFVVATDQNTPFNSVYFENVLGGGELVLSDDIFVNVPGVLKDRHKIEAQTIAIGDDQVAYIDIDDTQPGVPTTRTVNIVDQISFTADATKLIFLTSTDEEGYFGLHDPDRLENGDTINIQKNTSTSEFKGLNLHTTPGAPLTVTAAGGVTIGAFDRQSIFIESNGGAVNITANPQITAGTTSGQEIVLVGTDDTNYIILEDGDGLALNGPVNLRNQSTIYLFWTGILWQEISRR